MPRTGELYCRWRLKISPRSLFSSVLFLSLTHIVRLTASSGQSLLFFMGTGTIIKQRTVAAVDFPPSWGGDGWNFSGSLRISLKPAEIPARIRTHKMYPEVTGCQTAQP